MEPLSKCGLSLEEYFEEHIWSSGIGQEKFCQDPDQLYEMVVGTPQDLIKSLVYVLRNKSIIDVTNKPFVAIDQPSYPDDEVLGRCFEVPSLPLGTPISIMNMD